MWTMTAWGVSTPRALVATHDKPPLHDWLAMRCCGTGGELPRHRTLLPSPPRPSLLQQFLFLKQKCRALFNQRKRPAKLAWTTLYRKQHRKVSIRRGGELPRYGSKRPAFATVVQQRVQHLPLWCGSCQQDRQPPARQRWAAQECCAAHQLHVAASRQAAKWTRAGWHR